MQALNLKKQLLVKWGVKSKASLLRPFVIIDWLVLLFL
ncbi:hypothetical protein CLW00_103246 [Mongoliibacter ruber]|uniref:Uncharacterized protein n=1 Tax=Mongoliibacter ruber TaxID=1750599 RepID=A0A2T0WRH1_9BACT|nr:hypothetical protein CLW00_103246 [Mongoliibacter ruber]